MMYNHLQGIDAGNFGNVSGYRPGGMPNPYAYTGEFEFTPAQVTEYNLPLRTDTIACFGMIDNRIDFDIHTDIDLNSSDIFVSSPQFVAAVVNPPVVDPQVDDLGNQPISRAAGLNILSILLSMIGVMNYYF